MPSIRFLLVISALYLAFTAGRLRGAAQELRADSMFAAIRHEDVHQVVLFGVLLVASVVLMRFYSCIGTFYSMHRTHRPGRRKRIGF